MEYLLLAESDPVKLSLNVNRNLENGWVLYGNPSIQVGPQNSLWHYQAIVHNTMEQNLQQPTTSVPVSQIVAIEASIVELSKKYDCLKCLDVVKMLQQLHT